MKNNTKTNRKVHEFQVRNQFFKKIISQCHWMKIFVVFVFLMYSCKGDSNKETESAKDHIDSAMDSADSAESVAEPTALPDTFHLESAEKSIQIKIPVGVKKGADISHLIIDPVVSIYLNDSLISRKNLMSEDEFSLNVKPNPKFHNGDEIECKVFYRNIDVSKPLTQENQNYINKNLTIKAHYKNGAHQESFKGEDFIYTETGLVWRQLTTLEL